MFQELSQELYFTITNLILSTTLRLLLLLSSSTFYDLGTEAPRSNGGGGI